MSAIRAYKSVFPTLANRVYVDPRSAVIGDVRCADDVSIWPFCSVRGDVHYIEIGARTNIQDNTVCHVTHKSSFNPNGFPLTIGEDVTVGHSATLHACTIGNRCLIGMGAIVLDGSIIEDDVLIAAGSLVPPNSKLESGFLYMGNPIKQKRKLTQAELDYFCYSSKHYVKLKDDYLTQS